MAHTAARDVSRRSTAIRLGKAIANDHVDGYDTLCLLLREVVIGLGFDQVLAALEGTQEDLAEERARGFRVTTGLKRRKVAK